MPVSQERINFTARALEKIREYMGPEPKQDLRIFLENGQYVLALDALKEGDDIIEGDGFRVLVDPASLKYVVGLTVDFVEDAQGGFFELSNAFSSDGGCNEGKGSCGCKHE
ncbi:MAG: iron-sulfur cluster assembly accessory protein [Chlamydiae bacterium]|nr:iron-sulfur cluster assembly accessory protein [Chlamydiota bacterium]